jgi:hypothetical protein
MSERKNDSVRWVAVLLTILVMIVSALQGYFTMGADFANNEEHDLRQDAEIKAIKEKQDSDHDILIRIDANITTLLKERGYDVSGTAKP